MQIQFDPRQQYQLDAVDAIVDLFEGQTKSETQFSVVREAPVRGSLSGMVQTERGLGNQLTLSELKVRENCRTIQERNDIDAPGRDTALESWELPALGESLPARPCLHFSVEMETGTGKTYVYLRTIHELAEKYGWMKFIIVVPSVAIREGVKENLRITAEHFRTLYSRSPIVKVYDGKRVYELKEFAQSNTLQILVMNIDAFKKMFPDDLDERVGNIIFKPTDGFGNDAPILTLQAAQPIVILDEPQNMESEKSQEAIKALRPLFTLRYSATHKNPYNVVYRLGPIEAFAQRLVKQIVVDSSIVEGTGSQAFVEVVSITREPRLQAKVMIEVQTARGPKRKPKTLKGRENLFHLSEEREAYRDGYILKEISAGPGEPYVEFNSGLRLRVGEQHGGVRDDVQAAQIQRTVKHHLDKELAIRHLGVKVLSLFFIDRVANYRVYTDDGPKPGRLAEIVEASLCEFAKDPRYRELKWLQLPADKLHHGYFAQDKQNKFKDANGSTADDATAYELIMGNKEQLLSLDEPLRFIFSHSALREGWDNPNVFQICTLNERARSMTKRQEIGRGLRLPVDQQGERVRDDSVNRLCVVSNESYDEFAKGLQESYENECGVAFGRVSPRAFARLLGVEEGEELGIEGSRELWHTLQSLGVLNEKGDIQPGANVYADDYTISLPEKFAAQTNAVIDTLRDHRIERHVKSEKNTFTNRLRRDQLNSPEFQELWKRISAKTRYRVMFETDDLVREAIRRVKALPEIEPVQVRFQSASVRVVQAGVEAAPESVSHEEIRYKGPLPDLLAYLQTQTDLTRSTLQHILKGSGKLGQFLVNPQEFMDAVIGSLRAAMLQLVIDGIQYERIPPTEPDAYWTQEIFKDAEEIDMLTSEAVRNSIYPRVPFDSKVEQTFAKALDRMHETFRIFAKLPRTFSVPTPLGRYEPDWAIVKHETESVYLIRETKSTRDYEKLRTSEALKVRCGKKHFEALDVSFKVVDSVEQV